MAKAYLRINVEPGKEKEIKNSLLKIKGVRSVDVTTGEQDMIAIIEAPNYEETLKLVIQKLRTISGIKDTITSLVLE